MVEHVPEEHGVGGSIPSLGTILQSNLFLLYKISHYFYLLMKLVKGFVMKKHVLYSLLCISTVLYGADASRASAPRVEALVILIPKKFKHVIELEGSRSPDMNHPIYKHYHWEKKDKGGWKGSLNHESILNGDVTPED